MLKLLQESTIIYNKRLIQLWFPDRDIQFPMHQNLITYFIYLCSPPITSSTYNVSIQIFDRCNKKSPRFVQRELNYHDIGNIKKGVMAFSHAGWMDGWMQPSRVTALTAHDLLTVSVEKTRIRTRRHKKIIDK